MLKEYNSLSSSELSTATANNTLDSSKFMNETYIYIRIFHFIPSLEKQSLIHTIISFYIR